MAVSNFIDLTGQTFERWTVLHRVVYLPNPRRGCWMCRCECGTEKAVLAYTLTSGESKSCGCFLRDSIRQRMTLHGMARRGKIEPEFQAWLDMRNRVLNPRLQAFPYYGGRGIRICRRWVRSFKNFFVDLGPRPSPKHSLDRTNNEGHYSCGHCKECMATGWPANCRWATKKEQMNNRRANAWITFRGRTQTRMQWANELGINPDTLRDRMRHGWSIERMLTEPVKHKSQPVT